MSIQVVKFGGSSLSEAKHIEQAYSIIHQGKNLVVVLSAMGGITDLLLSGNGALEFYTRHQKAAEALGLWPAFEQTLSSSMSKLNVASGEQIMAQLMTELLKSRGHKAVFIDAPEIIKAKQGLSGWVHDSSRSDSLIHERLVQVIQSGQIPVVPGFIAESPAKEVVTLGRGGTDYTAAILASALNAESVTLYKEVDGFFTADPKYVSNPQFIIELHYEEAAELAYYGAKILHPRSIIPLIKQNIPLYLKNTFKPEQPGTKIWAGAQAGSSPVRALTAITNQALISIEGCGMIGVPGIAMRAFKAMSDSAISVNLISQASSEASICFTIPGSDSSKAQEALEKEFAFELSGALIERLNVMPNTAVVAVVGMGMKGHIGLSSRVFGAFRHADVNIMAIAQGSSEHNLSMVIDAVKVPSVIQTLHHEFFGHEAPNEVELVIHGFGQIGQALVQQLSSQKDYLKAAFGVAAPIKALTNSKGYKILERSDDFTPGELNLRTLGASTGVFVDVTASESHAVLIDAIKNGYDIVLANKKPLAGPLSQYLELFETAKTNRQQIRYEATVGAGLPIIDTISKLKQAGDKPTQIEGCFSGTLGYIMSALDSGLAFSKAVAQAQALGLTEPDPKDDLCGMDVARKALILARELDWDGEISQIEVESLAEMSDADFEERASKARGEGKRLRYVAQVIPGVSIRVGLQVLGPESPFYYLVGTTNQVSIKTPRYASSPLVVTGPGAGAGVTAAGVLNDIVSLAVRARS